MEEEEEKWRIVLKEDEEIRACRSRGDIKCRGAEERGRREEIRKIDRSIDGEIQIELKEEIYKAKGECVKQRKSWADSQISPEREVRAMDTSLESLCWCVCACLL